MALVILLWIAYVYLVDRCIFHGLSFGGFLQTVAVLAILFVVLIVWSVKRMIRPAVRPQQAAQRPAAPAASDSGSVTFRVAGTSYDNEDGESRQEILRHLKFGDAPWADGPEDLTAELEETEYNGETAFAVMVNGYQVGNVPRANIRQVITAREHVATCYVSSVRILGGGTDSDGKQLNYGCEITLEY